MRSVPSAVAEDLVVHLVVQPGAHHVRRLPVLAEHGEEPRDVAPRLVDALGGIPLRLLDGLLRLAAGLGDGLVVGLLALVDEPAPVLDGLVHVLECVLHGALGGHDVLQLHRGDPDAQPVGLVQVVHQLLALQLDVRALGADHVEDRAVTHQHVDDRLGDVADGLVLVLHVEEPGPCVGDLVLDDPLHVDDVQVPGEHDRFRGEVRFGVGGHDPGFQRAEPELFLQDPLRRHVVVLLHSEGDLEVQARAPPCARTCRSSEPPPLPSGPPRRSWRTGG